MRGFQLQSNHKKKHHHTQLAHLNDGVGVMDQLQSEGTDHHPRRQVTQHRAEPDAFEQRHCHHGGGKQRNDTQ